MHARAEGRRPGRASEGRWKLQQNSSGQSHAIGLLAVFSASRCCFSDQPIALHLRLRARPHRHRLTHAVRCFAVLQYIDPLVQATFNQDGALQEIVRTLSTRLRDRDTTVRLGSVSAVRPFAEQSALTALLLDRSPSKRWSCCISC